MNTALKIPLIKSKVYPRAVEDESWMTDDDLEEREKEWEEHPEQKVIYELEKCSFILETIFSKKHEFYCADVHERHVWLTAIKSQIQSVEMEHLKIIYWVPFTPEEKEQYEIENGLIPLPAIKVEGGKDKKKDKNKDKDKNKEENGKKDKDSLVLEELDEADVRPDTATATVNNSPKSQH